MDAWCYGGEKVGLLAVARKVCERGTSVGGEGGHETCELVDLLVYWLTTMVGADEIASERWFS